MDAPRCLKCQSSNAISQSGTWPFADYSFLRSPVCLQVQNSKLLVKLLTTSDRVYNKTETIKVCIPGTVNRRPVYPFRFSENFRLHSDCESRDSTVGIVTGYGLDAKGSEFESRWRQEFSLLHVVQTGSGAHPTFYPMGTGGLFPRG
jgi:hypothetical protein